MGRFTNKVVVITGGNGGIGLAAAQEFAREGAKVVVTGRNPSSLAEAEKVLGPDALVVPTDVTKSADLDDLFQTVRDRHGRIDVLFANAGTAKLAPVEGTSEAMFDEIINTNFRGAYFTVQKALPLLSEGGAIVFTTSWFVQAGVAGTSVVSASKAALRNFARTLASELLPRKIRVNAISPGVVETPLFGKLGLSEASVQELGQHLMQRIPAKRFGTPEEIAKAVTFLASDDASYITGVELAVDGGLTQL
ncbi:SDR family oxidoreductase [Azospirillum canadense]|uniref:SDR family oxidoreductase n=1 Tax=Azospirillum canadense TaxID=403962 RepID=UPI002226A151|nr:SDR family oxidoreductase [Azospirillum canadense]MCW2242449.1 NAD(P)-dependent dehydrogenase (short-subunit alcohol dehydrogenase family) [Azospirillum canadense]